MIRLDAGPIGGGGSFLRTALVLSAILQKPVTIENIALERTFQGLSADKIALIRALATATDAKLFGVETGSTTISFSPTHPWSQKKVALGLQGSVSLALQGLLLPALFSRQKVRFLLTGRTHELHAPTTTYMQQVFFRYVNSLVDQLVLRVNSFGFESSGDVEVIVKGRVNRLPPLYVSGGESLAGIRMEIIASKDYVDSTVLEHLERLARLTHPQLQVVTRYVASETPGIAAGVFAFYGNELGFDNDKPFVIGKDIVLQHQPNTDALEKEFIGFVQGFVNELTSPAIDEFCADQLIMLLALVGGEIKVKEVTDQVKANIVAAEAISDTLFEVSGTIITATLNLDAL